jgi:hypothetical protein
VPRVIVSPTADASLTRLVLTHSLPGDAKERFKRSLAPLADFPLLGRALEGSGYDGLRFTLGPWRWMVIVYEYDSATDLVQVLIVEDARSSHAATLHRA